MDRLVKPDRNEVEVVFIKSQKCSSTFKLTNLMHTMTVAVSLTTTNPSIFSINKPFSIIPPLSSSNYILQLTHHHHPPLSDPPDAVTVRTAMLPVGKAHHDDLRRLFSKPGPHVFRDAVLTISLVGPTVAEFLITTHHTQIPESFKLFTNSLSQCTKPQLTNLIKPAIEQRNVETVAVLIKAGANPNFRDSTGKSLIPYAIRHGNFDILKLLVDSGTRIENSVDLVLHEAAAMNRIDFMELLLDSFRDELDVNLVNRNGETPIHVAAIHDHVEAIEFSVSIGVNPNAIDINGSTALHFAASNGNLNAVECLLECSNVKYVKNRFGKTAFSLGEENKHFHLAETLRFGDLLFRAARVDDVHALKRLLGEGAWVNRRDQNGWTALHWAAFKGRIKSVKVLVDHGAWVDAVDDAGYTPLHCAVEAGHLQVAILLIGHGGSQVSLKSFQGVVATLDLDSLEKHVTLRSSS
ncbi:hypothetical protein HN51_010029 [Arachis hypogaea]|uniref:MSP domain-containing protein n=1 Tax=Arachis hypogaea TaxID=3818 RepID=A0A445E4B8_ARAHY|nr:uncharacterized protein LOC112786886 [Arachis hypogaea]QHO55028.1 Putative ankyrin repeat protein [Arachis hypogaea]RYR70294.1 hypothetical protein Ahy_A03g016798 [Arachis hypogaea]